MDSDGLLRENAELRGLLWEQWEFNHSEHCGGDWPHPEGKRCLWPFPVGDKGEKLVQIAHDGRCPCQICAHEVLAGRDTGEKP